jgi:hypothetical protein
MFYAQIRPSPELDIGYLRRQSTAHDVQTDALQPVVGQLSVSASHLILFRPARTSPLKLAFSHFVIIQLVETSSAIKI